MPDATRGVVQFDKFGDTSYSDFPVRPLATTLPELDGGVVIYGYGPEVATLVAELDQRGIASVVIEEDEDRARRLQERGLHVVHARPAEYELDPDTDGTSPGPWWTNSGSERSAVLTMSAREQGFEGPIVAMIENPSRRSVMTLAGATAVFTPRHVLAAALAARASTKITPRLAGASLLEQHLEIAELRVDHGQSAGQQESRRGRHRRRRPAPTSSGSGATASSKPHRRPTSPSCRARSWSLPAVPDSIRAVRHLARPIPEQGPIVLIGFGVVGQKVHEVLSDAGEEVSVLAAEEADGVDVVGDLFRSRGAGPVADARRPRRHPRD